MRPLIAARDALTNTSCRLAAIGIDDAFIGADSPAPLFHEMMIKVAD